MDAVWRYSFYTDTSTVTVHIRRLRAKIEPDPAQPRHIADRVGRRLPVPAVSVGSLARAAGAAGGRARRRWSTTATAPARPVVLLALAAAASPCSATRARVLRRRDRAARAGRSLVGRDRRRPARSCVAAVAAALMFVSAHDALLAVMVVVCSRGAVARAGRAAACAGARPRDVEAMRDGLDAVGEGAATSSCAVTASPTSSPELAGAADAMVDRELGAHGGARRATWSPPSRTTCARRSRRCGCWPRRSTTTSSTTTTRRGYLAPDAHARRARWRR